MTSVTLSWRGDPQVKANAVASMQRHRRMDRFIRGQYVMTTAYDDSIPASVEWAGCFHGCLTVEALAAEKNMTVTDFIEHGAPDWYAEGYRLWGIPYVLGETLDDMFESFEDRGAAGDWAVAITQAIPVGVDLHPLADELYPDDDDWVYPTPQELVERLAAL